MLFHLPFIFKYDLIICNINMHGILDNMEYYGILVIIIRLQRPESGCVVWALACVGVCVVRPSPGGRHSHAARRAGRDRGASGARASGAGDAVNG